MNEEKILVFDIWGAYAHFKKIYLTTSALTYAIPFKTSIYGLVGAILGLEKNENQYLNNFNENNCKIAIQLINPVRFQKFNINLSDEPGPIKKNRKPTLVEYIKRPHYRIYFFHNNEDIFNILIKLLSNKNSVYTPVLGISHCLANINLIGIFTFYKSSVVDTKIIHSIIPKSHLIEFDSQYWIDNNLFVQEQNMYPLEMNLAREVIKRDSIFYEINGKPMKAKVKEYYKIKINSDELNVTGF